MVNVDFDTSKVSPRENQIIRALICFHLSFVLSAFEAQGANPYDTTTQTKTAQATADFLRQFFPDLNFQVN
jgi:hypothetical protein